MRKSLFAIALFIPCLLTTVKTFAEDNQEEPPITSPTRFKEPPKRPKYAANVIVEVQEILDACADEHICVEGLLYNDGLKTAYDVKLRIDLGASKTIKPRTSIYQKVEQTTMEAGDRQEYNFMIPRKVPYKVRNEDKVIEVGKFNFQVVPLWKDAKAMPKPKPAKKPAKSTKPKTSR